MGNYLILTEEQANTVRGFYGSYSAIDPQPLPDGTYFVPERCMSDTDLADALSTLQTMDDDIQEIDKLPTVGGSCVAGTIYAYDGGVLSGYSDMVICVQSHTRTIYDPWDTPALFTFTRPETGNLEWIPNEQVSVGWERIYLGITYVVTTAHLTQEAWVPPLTLGTLWAIPSDGSWAIGVAYSVNDEVSYEGDDYKCLQGHTSQAGWEPPNVPALWELL